MILRVSRVWSNYKPVATISRKFADQQVHKQQRATYKVLFFGSDHFSVPSLRILNEYSQSQTSSNDGPAIVSELAAVTSLKGTANAVRKYLTTTDVRTHSWPLRNPLDLCSQYDVGVVVSFGHMIPEAIIESFRLGMINVHASLLPRWRGAAPIIHALRQGDRQTGVTIMRIRPRQFDVGEVLAQRSVPIGCDTLMPELHANLAQVGAELLLENIRLLEARLHDARVQDERHVTYAPKITDELLQVHWHRMSAQDIYNLYRALYSYKRLTTNWCNLQIRIDEMRQLSASDERLDLATNRTPEPGTVEYCRDGKCLRVWCADARCVFVNRLSVVGKRTFSATEFNNGYLKRNAPLRSVDESRSMFV